MAQQAKEAVRPTLFIGLGGTGKEILLRMRRRFYEKWRVTGLPITGYIWIDTDSRDVLAQGEKLDAIDAELKFESHEKVALLEGSVGQDLGNILREKARHKYIHEWLHPEVEQFGVEVGNGAGAVRSIGRLAFFDKFRAIEERIRITLGQITDSPQINETSTRYLPGVEIDLQAQVYLVFSVAGGTGGGTFLDISFLLRDEEFRKKVTAVNGVMLMPNVYYRGINDEAAIRSYGNAYSALKELEFFTRRIKAPKAEGDDRGLSIDFETNWRGKREVMPGPPFSVLYLCEMQSEGGFGAGNRTELFHMIAESLFLDFLPGPFSTQKRSRMADLFQYMASVQDDAVAVEMEPSDSNDLETPADATPLQQSFSRRYATLGMSKIEIPVGSIREACACHLAAELMHHVNRIADNPDLIGALDATASKFNADGLEEMFGKEWRETIMGGLEREFPLALPRDVEQSPQALDAFVTGLSGRLSKFENDMVSTESYDPHKWGRVTTLIRNSTARLSEDLRKALRTWMSDIVEKPELGLAALRKENGLIELLRSRLKRIYKEEPIESAERAAQAEADAEAWREYRNTVMNQMTAAAGNRFIQLLGLRSWTLQTLYERIRESAEEQAKSKAAAVLATEAGKLAKVADEFLRDQLRRTETFATALTGLETHFTDLEAQFRKVEETHLSIRLFTEEDFNSFYRLDFDERAGKHLPVSVPAEYKKFRDDVLSGGDTLRLMENWERQGDTWLRDELRRRTTKRFEDDFATCADQERHRFCGRMTEVLKHRQMEERPADIYERFVRSALPMLVRERRFAGSPVKSVNRVFLGLPATGHEPYLTFQKEIENKLLARGYTDIATFPTNDPTAIRLFIETYAFPLAAVSLVVGTSHKLYHEFYASKHAVQKLREHRIPLHLCAPWEGEFDDLKPIEHEEARATLEALKVLCLGPTLNVLDVKSRTNRREYGIWQWVPPTSQRRELGTKREAINFLVHDEAMRKKLLDEIHTRINLVPTITGTDGSRAILDYFWALSYLSFAVFPPGTPENTFAERARKALDGTLKPGRDYTELSNRLTQEAQAQHCKQMLLNHVEWVRDYPILKALPPLVIGKNDVEPMSV